MEEEEESSTKNMFKLLLGDWEGQKSVTREYKESEIRINMIWINSLCLRQKGH